MDKGVLDKTYKELLEEKIIDYIVQKKGLTYRDAMNAYYCSKLAKQINDGLYGIENMDYRYLVDDLLENEKELFE